MECSDFTPPQMAVQPQLHEMYHGAICDGCDWPILGVRFKCLNCPDFDLCVDCESEMKHEHSRQHVFLQISRPLPRETEETDAWKRLFPLPLVSQLSLTGNVHRGVFCTLCKDPICGARFVCCNCAEMFNLCSKCFDAGPSEKHVNGRNHVFVKIPFAPQIEENLSGQEYDVDPCLYRTPEFCPAPDEYTGKVVQSPMFGDLNIPLLPVVFVGSAAVNPLSRSAEKLANAQSNVPRLAKVREHLACQIREMTREDVDAVMAIEKESFARPFDRDYFLHILGRGHYFAWVATNHVGKVVGYIALRIRNSWTEVQSLAVGSEARGLGVGRGLMEQMLRLADAYQTNVKLHVSVFNSPALALYKSLGFSPSKWLMDYYAAEEEDAIEMYLMKR